MTTRRKLTDAQARAAREAYAAGGVTTRSLAAQLGIRQSNTLRMLNGETYASAGGPVTSVQDRLMAHADRVLRARVAELEARVADLEFQISEMTAAPPAFADLGLPRVKMLLLGILMRRPGMLVTYDSLMAASGTPTFAALRTHLCHLRKVVPGITIRAIGGLGYVARYAS